MKRYSKVLKIVVFRTSYHSMDDRALPLPSRTIHKMTCYDTCWLIFSFGNTDAIDYLQIYRYAPNLHKWFDPYSSFWEE